MPAPIDSSDEGTYGPEWFYIETLICDFLRKHDGQSVSSRDDISLPNWLSATVRAVGRMTWENPGSASEGIDYLSNLLSECDFKNEKDRAFYERQLNNFVLAFKDREESSARRKMKRKEKKKGKKGKK